MFQTKETTNKSGSEEKQGFQILGNLEKLWNLPKFIKSAQLAPAQGMAYDCGIAA